MSALAVPLAQLGSAEGFFGGHCAAPCGHQQHIDRHYDGIQPVDRSATAHAAAYADIAADRLRHNIGYEIFRKPKQVGPAHIVRRRHVTYRRTCASSDDTWRAALFPLGQIFPLRDATYDEVPA